MNRRTGDVWDLVQMKRVESPVLDDVIGVVRDGLGISRETVKRFQGAELWIPRQDPR